MSLAALLMLGLMTGLCLWSAGQNRGHSFNGRCDSCHLTNPENSDQVRFTRAISHLCQGCHSVSRANSHPIGIAPSMELPEGFLLDWAGQMTCATCHDPHAAADNRYLRTTARGREFCQLCHRNLLPMEDPHVGTVGIAHSKRGVYRNPSQLSRVLDPVSLECLGCHDGVIASDASYQIVGEDAVTYARQGLSHPIGMNYREVAMRTAELKPLAALSPYIALYDGKVGCASCHNPYSSEQRMLTMSNVGSALCLECHIK